MMLVLWSKVWPVMVVVTLFVCCVHLVMFIARRWKANV